VHGGTVEEFSLGKSEIGPDGAPLNPDVLRRDVLYPALDRLRIPGSKVLRAFMHFGTLPEVLGKPGLTTQIGAEALAAQQHQHDGKYLHARYEAGRTSSRYRLSRAYFGDPFPVVPNWGNGNKKEAVN
jgi:hypothetical protein